MQISFRKRSTFCKFAGGSNKIENDFKMKQLNLKDRSRNMLNQHWQWMRCKTFLYRHLVQFKVKLKLAFLINGLTHTSPRAECHNHCALGLGRIAKSLIWLAHTFWRDSLSHCELNPEKRHAGVAPHTGGHQGVWDALTFQTSQRQFAQASWFPHHCH